MEPKSHALLETHIRSEAHQLSWGHGGEIFAPDGPVVSSAPRKHWWERKEGQGREGGRGRTRQRDAIGETLVFWHGFQVIAVTKKENCFPFRSQESTYFPFTSPIAVFVHTRLSACGFVTCTFLCWDMVLHRRWVEYCVQDPGFSDEWGGCF